jgi:hypothetical protein
MINSIIFSDAFLFEIEQLALQIAKSQRNEDHMQDAETLYMKFEREQKELAEEDAKGEEGEQWDELPDVTYYAACMQIVASGIPCTEEALSWLASEIKKRDVSIAQLEAGCLAKYRMRASYEKSLITERNAILSAVAQAD